MRKLSLCLVIPALLALPARATAGELKLSLHNGLVTLTAQDVPLSTILAEWARIGHTKVVNGDQIRTPVTLQLVDVPERKALDILLRNASGYMLAQRPAQLANASAFDRILILPTSRPPANTGPVNAAPPPTNVPPRPMPTQPVPDMDDDDAGQLPVPAGMQPPTEPPGMPSPAVPQAQPGQPGQPGGSLTAPRPGQLPAPAPQQPVPFGAPRPPGGPGGPPTGPGGSGGPEGVPGGPGGVVDFGPNDETV